MNIEQTITTAPRQAEAANDPAEWVDRHGDALYYFALGQVRNPQMAEDLVQDTFLAAFKARDRFCGESTERTWLIGILRHKIFDYLRQITQHKVVALEANERADGGDGFCEPLAWLHECAAECAAPERRMELEEFRNALELALGRLPRRIAQVFELYEVKEQSGRDVCRVLNISDSNLWVTLHRARKQLRQELSDWKVVGWETRRYRASC